MKHEGMLNKLGVSYTFEEMRLAEKETLESAMMPAFRLMLRAGQRLAEQVKFSLQELNRAHQYNHRSITFVCGGGNNGGDGFTAAQILHEEKYDVTVICLAEKFSDLCEYQKSRYTGRLINRIPKTRPCLIVDCVLGIGISRAPEGDAKALIDFINGCGTYVVSADIPSGLGEHGQVLGSCVVADETVCFGHMKNALLLEEGPDYAGRIHVEDIGVYPWQTGAELWLNYAPVGKFFPERKKCSNKGTFGCTTVIAGSRQYSGAAILSASACLKTGVGYVRLCVPSDLFPHYIGKLPSCILQDGQDITREVRSSQCVAAGMGMGATAQTYHTVEKLLQEYEGVLVLDADALNVLAEYGKDILKQAKCRVVLTPHLKEFSRLTGRSVQEIKSNLIDEAKNFAREYGVILLLKSNTSVVTDGERLALVPVNQPVLARAGSGDILSGYLAGTCARGVAPFDACCVSTYVLGFTAAVMESAQGEYIPNASDLLSYLYEGQHVAISEGYVIED